MPAGAALNTIQQIAANLSHLLFPQLCAGCGSDLIQKDQLICLHCEEKLDELSLSLHSGNRVEKIFRGRLKIAAAASIYSFFQDSLIQGLIHELKYRGDLDLGRWLGRRMAKALISSERFRNVTVLLPLPLFGEKLKKRGYNQSAILCQGIYQEWQIPVLETAVIRNRSSSTQTHKNRWERWQNVEGIFEISSMASLEYQHVLLVDDVITTGATLEACGSALAKVPGLTLSIATLAFADK